MATYYFGDIELGDFIKHEDYRCVALIHAVHDTKDFATDEEAEDYMKENNYSGYIDANIKNVEIYFRKR